MSPYPIYLNALVGTFANDGRHRGHAVSHRTRRQLPGTGRGDAVQLGVNEDFFADNEGSLTVCVSDAGECVAAVPEPVSASLLALGLSGLAVRRRRRA